MLKCALHYMRWWGTRAHRPAICTSHSHCMLARFSILSSISYYVQLYITSGHPALYRIITCIYSPNLIFLSQPMFPGDGSMLIKLGHEVSLSLVNNTCTTLDCILCAVKSEAFVGMNLKRWFFVKSYFDPTLRYTFFWLSCIYISKL